MKKFSSQKLADTLIKLMPMMMLALSVMAFLSSRQSAVSSEVSVTDDLEDSVTTFSSAVSNFISQHVFNLFSAFYLLINSIDKSLSLQGALGQTTELPNVTNTTVDFLTLQTQLTGYYGQSIFFNAEGDYIFTSDGSNIRVISIDNPLNPINLWSQIPGALTNGEAKNIFGVTTNNQMILGSAFYCVFKIVDMSNPVAPVILSEQSLSGCVAGYAGSSNAAVLSPDGQSIRVAYLYLPAYILGYNLSNASGAVSFIPLSYGVNSLVYNLDGTIIVAAMTTNIAVFSVNPQNVSDWKLNNTIACNNPQKTAFTGNNLLLASYNDATRGQGFYIYNMSQVNVRTWLSTFNTNSTINKMISTKNGLRVYAACNAGIFVIDVSNPRYPALLFNATTAVGETYSLTFDQAESFLYAATSAAIKVFKIHDTILIPTFVPPTLIPPTSLPLTLIPPTPLPIAPTNVPPTPVPTAEPFDPFKNVTLTSQPEIPSNITLAPGTTNAPLPPLPRLQINAAGNQFLLMASDVASTASMMLKIKVVAYIGKFMRSLLSVITTYEESLGILTIIGSATEVNNTLRILRFSLDNPAFNASVVKVIASLDGGVSYIAQAFGNLTQFGSNDAPVMLDGFYPAITRNLGESFSQNLEVVPPKFRDPNHDLLNYLIYLLDGSVIPSWTDILNNIFFGSYSRPINLTIAVAASDGYKESASRAIFQLVYQYFLPAFSNNAIASILVCKAGKECTFRIIRSRVTGTGALTFNAVSNGFSLPSSIIFDADNLALFVSANQIADYNITFIATDIINGKGNKTVVVRIIDSAPQASNTSFAVFTALAQIASTFTIPLNDLVTDADDPETAINCFFQPAVDWATLIRSAVNASLLALTLNPPARLMGNALNMPVVCTDGILQATNSLPVFIPAYILPMLNASILWPNVTGTVGTQVIYQVPDNAFISSYPLTGSAVELINPDQLVDLFQFDGKTLAVTFQNAGQYAFMFIETDPFGNNANKTIYIDQIETLAQNLWLIIGILSGATGITAVAQYFQLLVGIINAIKLTWFSRPCLEKPFSNNDYTYKINGLDGTKLKVYYYHQLNMCDLNIVKILFVPILILTSAPFLFTTVKHAIEQMLSLSETERPDWLIFDSETNTFTVDPDFIGRSARPVVVRAYKPNDFLGEGFTVDPEALKKLLELPTTDNSLPLLNNDPEIEMIDFSEAGSQAESDDSDALDKSLLRAVKTAQQSSALFQQPKKQPRYDDRFVMRSRNGM